MPSPKRFAESLGHLRIGCRNPGDRAVAVEGDTPFDRVFESDRRARQVERQGLRREVTGVEAADGERRGPGVGTAIIDAQPGAGNAGCCVAAGQQHRRAFGIGDAGIDLQPVEEPVGTGAATGIKRKLAAAQRNTVYRHAAGIAPKRDWWSGACRHRKSACRLSAQDRRPARRVRRSPPDRSRRASAGRIRSGRALPATSRARSVLRSESGPDPVRDSATSGLPSMPSRLTISPSGGSLSVSAISAFWLGLSYLSASASVPPGPSLRVMSSLVSSDPSARVRAPDTAIFRAETEQIFSECHLGYVQLAKHDGDGQLRNFRRLRFGGGQGDALRRHGGADIVHAIGLERVDLEPAGQQGALIPVEAGIDDAQPDAFRIRNRDLGNGDVRGQNPVDGRDGNLPVRRGQLLLDEIEQETLVGLGILLRDERQGEDRKTQGYEKRREPPQNACPMPT